MLGKIIHPIFLNSSKFKGTETPLIFASAFIKIDDEKQSFMVCRAKVFCGCHIYYRNYFFSPGWFKDR